MKQEQQYKKQGNTFLTIVALVILALAAGYLFAQGQNGLRVTIEPAGITSPASNPLVNNMAPMPGTGNTAVNAYVPEARAAEAKAVYDADPARATACMDAAVNLRGAPPACKAIIEALGTGR